MIKPKTHAIVPYEAPSDGDEHDELGKPFRVIAKLRNGRLIRAREQLGIMSTRIAAEKIGIKYQTLLSFESLANAPWNTKMKRWKPAALLIAEYYGYHPEELWPDVIKEVRETEAQFDIAHPSVVISSGDAVAHHELQERVREQLHTLNPKEQLIIERWFGIKGDEETQYEIGDALRISHTRVGQIAEKAIRKLRQPKRAKHLADFAEILKCPVCGKTVDEFNEHNVRDARLLMENRTVRKICDRSVEQDKE